MLIMHSWQLWTEYANTCILSDISQIRLNKTGVQKCAKTITYTKYVYFDSFSKGQLKILS